MKKYILLPLLLLLAFPQVTQAQTIDKATFKAAKKNYQYYDHGKTFKKAKRIALPGINLRFKVASRETITGGSWKTDDQTTFSSWAILNGIEESDFQEITEAFALMYQKKLESLGLEVLSPETYADSKHYAKLVEKHSKDRMTVKKKWGIAQVHSAGNRPFFVYPMSPLGSHAKFAKEQKALIGNMLITIDFAYIGMEVKRFSNRYHKSMKGTAELYPVIRLEGITENQLQVRTDGTYSHIVKDQSDAHQLTLQTEIYSDLEYAENIESCQDCIPKFAKNQWNIIGGANLIGTYSIQANREKFKAAVLNALDKYTDQLMIFYGYERQ